MISATAIAMVTAEIVVFSIFQSPKVDLNQNSSRRLSTRYLTFVKTRTMIISNGNISTNSKPTQDFFLLNHSIKTQRSSKYHMKPRSTNPIIGLDVSSGTSPINNEMLKNPSIFNLNLQEKKLTQLRSVIESETIEME